MKTVIVEDEIFAAQALQSLIHSIDASIEILATVQSIEESVEWFATHPAPDLVFMDIHLADGSSFAIFDELTLSCPVVFTTAYDEYALKAFEVNSIDYLLKPVSRQDLERAIGKYRSRIAASDSSARLLNQLISDMKKSERAYKSCFLIPEKDRLLPLSAADIAFICVDTKTVKAVTFAGRTYYLDRSLDEMVIRLNPADFFRANRQFIISRRAVKDLATWFGGKMAVNLCVASFSEKIIISREKSGEIKRWLAG
jgi:two-component system LytT family response regulator